MRLVLVKCKFFELLLNLYHEFLEQTLITELKPTLNSLCNSVLFTYNNWSLLNIYNYATDSSIAV